jgi:hypothetical protein
METGKLFIREDETGKPEVIFEPFEGTVWMNVNQIAKLFGLLSGHGIQSSPGGYEVRRSLGKRCLPYIQVLYKFKDIS